MLLMVSLPLSAEEWSDYSMDNSVGGSLPFSSAGASALKGYSSSGYGSSAYSTKGATSSSLAFANFRPIPASSPSLQIDRVLVHKARKRLLLLQGNSVVKEYSIALGKNPIGHKREEGDGRTPEGRYVLDWRNPESKFHRSIHISYPNEADVSLAQAEGKDPGEYIMIHGSPDWVPSPEWAKKWFNNKDWTDGCIAVTNDVMDEIWTLVADGTPIEIRP